MDAETLKEKILEISKFEETARRAAWEAKKANKKLLDELIEDGNEEFLTINRGAINRYLRSLQI